MTEEKIGEFKKDSGISEMASVVRHVMDDTSIAIKTSDMVQMSEEMPCKPKEIVSIPKGIFPDKKEEKAVALLLAVSQRAGGWVGTGFRLWTELIIQISRDNKDPQTGVNFVDGILSLKENDYVRIEKDPNDPLKQVYFPTHKLIELLHSGQEAGK